jgi:putative ABC transport system permease protein
MIKKLFLYISLAIENIRSHFFHTILSVLGIVIGVAALVIILSLIDGMEKYAQSQISGTTDLNTIFLQPNPYKEVNGIRIKKQDFDYFSYTKYLELISSLSQPVETFIQVRKGSEIKWIEKDSIIGVNLFGTAPNLRIKVTSGKYLDEHDLQFANNVVVINQNLSKIIEENSEDFSSSIGTHFHINGEDFVVIGVVENNSTTANAFIPFTKIAEEDLRQLYPEVYIEAKEVASVPIIKSELQTYLSNKNVSPDYKVITNEFRVKQATQGFLIFRIVMGLIVGVSVVVGGIGVMNVLLISVNERTVEIGIRKAMGAKRRDITMLFLAESITISVFGSLLGLLFGVVVTLGLTPVIKAITEVPFEAAFTFNTFLIISIIAIIIGIIFGTYPAVRASKLDPVEAIRKE